MVGFRSPLANGLDIKAGATQTETSLLNHYIAGDCVGLLDYFGLPVRTITETRTTFFKTHVEYLKEKEVSCKAHLNRWFMKKPFACANAHRHVRHKLIRNFQNRANSLLFRTKISCWKQLLLSSFKVCFNSKGNTWTWFLTEMFVRISWCCRCCKAEVHFQPATTLRYFFTCPQSLNHKILEA